MPTYDYECEACKHTFELFQSITAKPIRKCPACGKRKVRRLIGAGAGIIFKGSGFYCTDYRSDAYRQTAAKEKSAPTSSGGTEAKDSSAKASETQAAESKSSETKPSAKSKSANSTKKS